MLWKQPEKQLPIFHPSHKRNGKRKIIKEEKIASLNCGINATCDDFLPLQASHEFVTKRGFILFAALPEIERKSDGKKGGLP